MLNGCIDEVFLEIAPGLKSFLEVVGKKISDISSSDLQRFLEEIYGTDDGRILHEILERKLIKKCCVESSYSSLLKNICLGVE